MSEFRKRHREQDEARVLVRLKQGPLAGQYIPEHVRASLVKKGLIEEVRRLYFGPREWVFRLTPAGFTALAPKGAAGR